MSNQAPNGSFISVQFGNRAGLIALLLILTPTLAMAKDVGDDKRISQNFETYRSWNENVWCAGKYEFVKELITPEYTRHESDGTRIMTPESYAKEMEAYKARNVEFIYHDLEVTKDRVWTRFSVTLDDPKGGLVVGRGIQILRLENGRLTETWLDMFYGKPGPDLTEYGKITQCNFSAIAKD